MATAARKPNRVKQHRLAKGHSQEALAQAAGISRAGLSAIEGHRLIPSVSTALALARALGASVETLFDGSLSTDEPIWAYEPTRLPSRFWAADVGGRTVLYPLEPMRGLCVRQDGVAARAAVRSIASDDACRTLVIATCDPAASYLAQEYSRQTPFRMIVLQRTSREALDLLNRGLIHVAGVHLAESGSSKGNQIAVKQFKLAMDVQLLTVAKWEEGVAHASAIKLRSVTEAAHSHLRWIGRPSGAGARRCQDDILGNQKLPRHIASDHFEVVASIRAGFVDAGICVRLVAEEGNVSFLPVCEEDYDLCLPQSQADDPRIAALMEVVRSASYRESLAELPGYRLKRAEPGEIVSGKQVPKGTKA